eukprot:scaffold91430_cov33-Phaeocystis_antarctica.AAC.1
MHPPPHHPHVGGTLASTSSLSEPPASWSPASGRTGEVSRFGSMRDSRLRASALTAGSGSACGVRAGVRERRE